MIQRGNIWGVSLIMTVDGGGIAPMVAVPDSIERDEAVNLGIWLIRFSRRPFEPDLAAAYLAKLEADGTVQGPKGGTYWDIVLVPKSPTGGVLVDLEVRGCLTSGEAFEAGHALASLDISGALETGLLPGFERTVAPIQTATPTPWGRFVAWLRRLLSRRP